MDRSRSLDENRRVVERYVAALPAGFDELARLRHEEFVEEWPQSGETIRGHANYRAIHEGYPGGTPETESQRLLGSEDRWVLTPTFTPIRILGTGDTYTAVFSAVYPELGAQWIVAIIELREGKVIRQTTYFAPPFEAAAWRAAWVERKPEQVQEVR
jgi:hypothetical protein